MHATPLLKPHPCLPMASGIKTRLLSGTTIPQVLPISPMLLCHSHWLSLFLQAKLFPAPMLFCLLSPLLGTLVSHSLQGQVLILQLGSSVRPLEFPTHQENENNPLLLPLSFLIISLFDAYFSSLYLSPSDSPLCL